MSTLDELREAQKNAASASQQKVWADFVSAQEALVQQDREARLNIAIATSSASSIEGLLQASLSDEQKKTIGDAVGELIKATRAVEDTRVKAEDPRAKSDKAAAEIANLRGDIDKRAKSIKAALERVTRLQAEALALAKSTAADVVRKTYAAVQELKVATAHLEELTNKVDNPKLRGAIQTQLTVQADAQETIERLGREQKTKEDEQKYAEDRRKSVLV